jgi:hypothetical protein
MKKPIISADTIGVIIWIAVVVILVAIFGLWPGCAQSRC